MSRGRQEPHSSRDAILENLPNVADAEGKYVAFEVDAPERSNINVIFDPPKLRDYAEAGLWRKDVRTEMERTDEAGNNLKVKMIEEEFELKKDGLVKALSARTSHDEWIEANNEAITKLERLKAAVEGDDVNSMQELRGQMSLTRLSGRNEIGEEGSRALAQYIDEMREQKRDLRDQKKAVAEAIQAVIKQQIGVHEVLQLINEATRYDDLTEEAKSHVFRLYLNKRWGEEQGTVERNELLKRLCWRQDAPAMVMPGWERDVYQAVKDVESYKDQLATTDDPAKRAELEEAIKKAIASAAPGLSSLSHKDRAFWPGATGEEQVKHGGWAEIKDVIDQLRHSTDPDNQDRKGRPKHTIVLGTASYDQASWESLGIKTEIFFQFGIATNALKHIESLGATGEEQFNEFVNRGFFNDLENKPIYKPAKAEKNKLKDQLKKLEEDYSKTEKEYKKASEEYEKLKKDQKTNEKTVEIATKEIGQLHRLITGTEYIEPAGSTTDDAIEIIEAAAGVDLGGDPAKRANKQGQRNSNQVLEEELKTALGRRRTAELSLAKLKEVEEEYQNLDKKFNGEADATKPEDKVNLADAMGLKDLRERVAKGELEKDDAEEFEKQQQEALKKRFNDLLDKLRKYLGQRQYDVANDFNKRFSKEERKIIARLSGMATDDDGNAIQELANFCDTEDGFVGDYAFINGWALGEQNGRASADQLENLLKTNREPAIAALIKRAKEAGKIIIVTSFGVEHDVDGRIIGRVGTGAGPQFDQERAEEFMQANGWSAVELFEHWLDDLNLQRALGIRPEEIDEKYIAKIARTTQFRNEHFSGQEGWTFINTNVASSTVNFFETTIRRMVDEGCELTSHGLRKAPFYRQLGRSNEYAITITDENMNREVRYRGEKLNNNVEAPKTVVARLYRSIMNELELYYKRTQIGGQATSAADHMTTDDIDKLGSFVLANMELIRKKMLKLRTIAEHPQYTNDERLQMMLDFRETEMQDMTHDILDENGEFIEENSNPELWEEYNATAQWLGKLKRNLRESTWRYATTEANPHATDEEIETADADYEYHLNERRNFEVKIKALGMQAAGRMRDMDNKQVAEVFSKTHAKITGEELRRLQEEQMRARFQLDDDQQNWGNTLARRLVGKLAKNKIADLGRSIGRTFGIGDRYLKEVDAQTIAMDVRRKMDNSIFDRAAAHYAFAIQTGYQNSWGGIFNPSESGLIIPGSGAPGVDMSRTGEAYLEAMVSKRVLEDINDAVDRTIGNNMHMMINVGKNRGWNVDEIMKTYLDAKMNDTQQVVYENGQWQTDNYRKEGTRISQLETVFRRKVRTRLERSGWTPSINLGIHASPDETRAVPNRYANPSTTFQRSRHRDAAVNTAGQRIPLAGAQF